MHICTYYACLYLFSTDFKVTCGGRYITNDLIQIGCGPLNEAGPTIIDISYTINNGPIIRGTFIQWG